MKPFRHLAWISTMAALAACDGVPISGSGSGSDPAVPQRDYQLGTVTANPTTGRTVRRAVDTAKDGRDGELLRQGYVNETDFGTRRPSGSVLSTGADYR